MSDPGKKPEELNPEDAYNYLPPTAPKYSKAPISQEAWAMFFEELAKTGVTARACRKSGISVFSVHYYSYKYPLFALRMKICRELGAESLEAEAFRRAVDGVKRGVYWQGAHIATERVYSDLLLTFLLKGAKPDKYRERVSTENTNVNVDVPMDEASEDAMRARIAQKLLRSSEGA